MSPIINRKHLPLLVGLISTAVVSLIVAAVLFSSLNTKYGISVNGQTNIILATHEETQAVLDELKAYYTHLANADSIDVSSVTYEEDIKIAKTGTSGSEIKNKYDALQTLINQPYFHVVIKGVFKTTEDIDIEIKAQKKDTLLQNTAKIQQEGEKGSREATYDIVLKNNVPVEKTIREEIIQKEMVPKIVLEGNRPPRPGSNDEKLKYIINHESTGNVHAANGPYKGLGQLMDKYYQTYVGMSYAETLQQPDPYAVQVDAMLGYIYARYGSIEAAYNHWVKNHWY